MKKVIFTILLFSLMPLYSLLSQPVFYSQSFENNDSTSLPAGWSKWNMKNFPILPNSDWTIRDTGSYVPYCTRRSVAKDGKRSIMVSWISAVDTLGVDTTNTADCWLVTKQFRNLPTDALLSFYACGGTPAYPDSMQVWLSTSDSLPNHFSTYLLTLVWPAGVTYGNFQQNIIDLSAYANQNVRIGFRYYMYTDANTGYAVYLDLVEMLGTIGINQLGSNIPKTFALHQNYPNPFNPTTKIQFDIPRNTNAKVEVFNNLGQIVSVLHDGFTAAGYYETQFNAGNLTSGVYFYRITTQDFVQTKKMILVK